MAITDTQIDNAIPEYGDTTPHPTQPNQALMNKLLKDVRDEVGAASGSRLSMSNAIYSWWMEPLAVHYKDTKNKTYFGSISNDSNLWVFDYDHDTTEVNRTLLVEDFDTGYTPSDDHCAPVILMGRKGTADPVMVFYVGHNIAGEIYYKVSDGHESIASFGPENVLSVPTGTLSYAQVHRYNQTIILLCRRTDSGQRTWGCFHSTDNGTTWSNWRELLDNTDGINWKYIASRQNDQFGEEGALQEDNMVSCIISTHPINSTSQDFWSFNINLDTGGTSGGPNIFSDTDTFSTDDISGRKVYEAEAGEKTRFCDFISSQGGGGPFYHGRLIIASFTDSSDAVYKILYSRFLEDIGDVEASILSGRPVALPEDMYFYFAGACFIDSDTAVIATEEWGSPASGFVSGRRRKLVRWQRDASANAGTEWYPADTYLSIREGSDEFQRKVFRPYRIKDYHPYMPITYIDGVYSDAFNVFDTDVKTLPIYVDRKI